MEWFSSVQSWYWTCTHIWQHWRTVSLQTFTRTGSSHPARCTKFIMSLTYRRTTNTRYTNIHPITLLLAESLTPTIYFLILFATHWPANKRIILIVWTITIPWVCLAAPDEYVLSKYYRTVLQMEAGGRRNRKRTYNTKIAITTDAVDTERLGMPQLASCCPCPIGEEPNLLSSPLCACLPLLSFFPSDHAVLGNLLILWLTLASSRTVPHDVATKNDTCECQARKAHDAWIIQSVQSRQYSKNPCMHYMAYSSFFDHTVTDTFQSLNSGSCLMMIGSW